MKVCGRTRLIHSVAVGLVVVSLCEHVCVCVREWMCLWVRINLPKR